MKPLLRLVARWSQDDDPWERVPHRVSVNSFGRGSFKPFTWYFEGESGVRVESVDEVCSWLLDCEYVHDETLFNENDFWQHPRTFEHLRKGDCEDHAIWAWRKLVELGLDAELVSGEWRPPGKTAGDHVWVRFRHEGQDFILESVSDRRERMVVPFSEAKAEYVPHAGVDRTFRHYVYFGYLRRSRK
jgi:hypothetical protein